MRNHSTTRAHGVTRSGDVSLTRGVVSRETVIYCFCSELNKIGTAGHTDPLAFPVMSLISMTAGRISVGMYEDTPIKVWNRTLDKLDFRDYIYIEPESERRGLSSFVIQRLMCVWHACREQRAASISQRSRDDIIHSTGRCSISRHVRYVY